eukprot:CAMPEP_0184503348 /NCGR_PEP_ID=MMETSP0113_2-20130426/51840_1 /TAXON_ID=91329 /ORGANISM="Norrisiella sphaerica, Strain BC52" /LENGTH=288 /DNA_ID=CAMNT_0026892831 /DNA_START=1656 /DNA_END=2519 /DNA_ORIENTATION=+
MDSGGVREMIFDHKPMDFSKLKKSELIDEADHDIVTLDGFQFGVHNKILKQCFSATKGDNRIGIVVSSMQSYTQVKDLLASHTEEHRLASWMKEEFEEAIKNDQFYDQVKNKMGDGNTKKQRLNSKFYYAGLSARFMFHLSIEQVKEDIQKGLSRLNSKTGALAGKYSQEHSNAVNTLHAGVRTADGYVKDVFVSRYTLEQMYLVCPNQLAHAYHLAYTLGNESFLGWVVEADFLMGAKEKVKNKESITLYDSNCAEKFEMKPTSWQSFDDTEDIKFKKNTLYIPNPW